MTPGQAASLADQAARAFGGSAHPPRLLKLRENAVFAVALPGGPGVLRLHRQGYQTAAAIRSELWWMSALSDAGVPVPRPFVTEGGDTLATLPGGRLASALSWVEGEPMGEAGVPFSADTDTQIAIHASLGRALARMHTATDNLTLPADFTRPRWDLEGLLGETPFWGRFWDHPAATPDQRALLLQARAHAAAELAEYVSDKGNQGLIHADVLRENVLLHRGQAALIDFDDCGFGFRLHDLGTALVQSLHEPALPLLSRALLDGYAAERPLSHRDRAILPLMVLLRCCASVGWTMPRLAPDDPIHASHLARATRAARIVLSGGDLFLAEP